MRTYNKGISCSPIKIEVDDRWSYVVLTFEPRSECRGGTKQTAVGRWRSEFSAEFEQLDKGTSIVNHTTILLIR